MDDVSERLLGALSALDDVADEVTPDDAGAVFDDAALQVFWRDWPRLASWAGAVWRRLDSDPSGPASPVADGEFDEVGGEGG